MSNCRAIVSTFLAQFQSELRQCPLVNASFYNSFTYTTTGANYCHPRTIGLLMKAFYALPQTAAVDVDVRFNAGEGVKFQPDLVGLDRGGGHLLIVDFESPNSSDARLMAKDVEPYVKWIQTVGSGPPPYLIITSLPVRPGPGQWQLRYTSLGRANDGYAQLKTQILSNPFGFWYGEYRKQFRAPGGRVRNLQQLPIYFANLDGLQVDSVCV